MTHSKLTLDLMLTLPLNMPIARYCPSLVQLQLVILLAIFVLLTDFCSGDQRPKSVIAQLAS